MFKGTLSRIAGSAVFAVGVMLSGGTASAGTVGFGDVGDAIVDISIPLDSRIRDRVMAMSDSRDSAAWSMEEGRIDESANVTTPHFGIGEGGGRKGYMRGAYTAGFKRTDPEEKNRDNLLPGSTGLADVPLPPALLLLSSAIVGLVTVARRDNEGRW